VTVILVFPVEKLGQSRVLRSKYEKRPEERGAEKEPTTQPKAAEDGQSVAVYCWCWCCCCCCCWLCAVVL
jgi:hypothetical protein